MNDFSSPLILWYEENKRDLPWRRTRDPYAIWVSEIMLQQTRVEAVKPYYARFLAELPDIPSLAAAPLDFLYKLWQGLGYYSRVRNMKKAAQICVDSFSGALPRTYAELRRLPGIGDYTAAAIASFAFDECVPAVDGNVRRVVARCLSLPDPLSSRPFERAVSDFLVEAIPADNPASFNQALIELGATVCGPDRAARCGGCPLLRSCRAFSENKTDSLPLHLPKPERRVEARTPLILSLGESFALEKRPDPGLLPGLWQPPTLPGHPPVDEILAFLSARGCAVLSISPLPPARHVFTHIVWDMRAYLVTLSSGGDFSFFSPEQRKNLALPSAFKAYKEFLGS